MSVVCCLACAFHAAGNSPVATVFNRQGADGVVCLAGTVIDRRHRLAEHASQSTIK